MDAAHDGARLANELIANYNTAAVENTLLSAAQRLPAEERGLAMINAASYAIEAARFLLRSMHERGIDAESELVRLDDYIVSTQMERLQRAHEILGEMLRAQRDQATGGRAADPDDET
jgi:hypothetical protein